MLESCCKFETPKVTLSSSEFSCSQLVIILRSGSFSFSVFGLIQSCIIGCFQVIPGLGLTTLFAQKFFWTRTLGKDGRRMSCLTPAVLSELMDK